MYPVSVDFLNKVKETNREWSAQIEITSAQPLLDSKSENLLDSSGNPILGDLILSLTNKDVELGSLKYKEGATCGDAIQTGSTFCNSFSFSLMNDEGQFNAVDLYGAKIKAKVGLDLGDSKGYEYVPLGEFYVIDPVKKFTTIPVTCFDAMCFTNKSFDSSKIVFPTTCSILVQEIIKQCNIIVEDAFLKEVATIATPVESLLTNEPTCRDILAGIGLFLKKNLRFNRNGKLETFWYANVNADTNADTRVGASEYTDRKVKVTGVYLEDAYGNVFNYGDVTYPVELPYSPIIQGEEVAMKLLQETLTVLQQIEYLPGTVYPLGNPAVQAGDIVIHTGTTVGDIAQPIMLSTYTFGGKTTWISKGIDPVEENQETQASRDVSKIFARTDADKNLLQTKIQQTATDVILDAEQRFADKSSLSQLKVSVDGISSSVQSNTNSIDKVESDITKIKQDSTAVELNFSKKIEDLESSTDNRFTEINSYIRFENGSIYIGRDGDTVQLIQSNSKLAFVDVGTGKELAYISNGRFYCPAQTVDNELILGGYSIEATNGLVFKWIGG